MGVECLQGRETSSSFCSRTSSLSYQYLGYMQIQDQAICEPALWLPIRLLNTVTVPELLLKGQEFHNKLAKDY